VIIFRETDEGLLISARETLALNSLEAIGDALQEQGISLEELIESGRNIRQEIYDEKYARDSND
jgi:hypothetical protein